MSGTLLIQFDGWCSMRLATDPDPTDETRGASGYTFAFGDEPDLDRVIHLQVPKGFTPRSHGPEIGVQVRQASRLDTTGTREIAALQGARVELLDRPRLENRNWTLTLPGFEPIVPFNLRISGQGIELSRSAPIDPEHPNKPVWEMKEADLLSHAANGMEYEPATVGRATGLWNAVQAVTRRLEQLKGDLQGLDADDPKTTILQGRIAELEYALANPTDRRIIARYYVERFGFDMLGKAEVRGDQERLLDGILQTDTAHPWQIYFWLGAWDPDALCAFMQGTLEIPYADGSA